MPEIINVYCDESCHLENDGISTMLLGAIWAPKSQLRRLNSEIKAIKLKHNSQGEIKWNRVSNSRARFFESLIEWFFNESALHFRALIIPDKGQLDHARFNNGSHDDFYYKMYFSMIRGVLSPENSYNIYLDIKDTRSNFKVLKLYEVLANDQYDFTQSMVQKVQQIRSDEAELLQLCDLLLGALSYKFRELSSSEAKLRIIQQIEVHHPNLTLSTPASERKFNIFVWKARARN